MTEFRILKTPLGVCLAITDGGHTCMAEPVVGAWIRLDNPYACHPRCEAHAATPPRGSAHWIYRHPADVQDTQELLIADARRGQTFGAIENGEG